MIFKKIHRNLKWESEAKKWRFDKRRLDARKRSFGISGFMRLKNEEDFLHLAIESHLPFLDELIIVFNDCSDSTPDICFRYQKKFPDKIKVLEYEPKVYPQGSEMHKRLPGKSIHSLVNYYNFALSKTNYSVAVKIDGDHVAIPHEFERVTQEIRRNGLRYYWRFKGINLWDEGGEIYVNGNRPLTSGYDTGFFPVSSSTFFIKHPMYEQFKWKIETKYLGVLFFHLKNMKRDRGVSVYDLTNNPNSEYWDLTRRFYTNPHLIKWKDFCLSDITLGDIESIESLGIKPLRR